jgi:hypothetical protein
MWGRGRKALGLVLGGGAALLAYAILRHPDTSGAVALRATLVVALILCGLAVFDVVTRYVAEPGRAGARPRPRFL